MFKMNEKAPLLVSSWLLLMVMCYPVSTHSADKYLQEIFSPIEITKRIHLPARPHRRMTGKDKQALREARLTLARFMKSFKSHTDNPIEYLAPTLRNKYKSRVDLYAKEFGAESLLEMQIFDFLIKPSGEILFYVVVTDTTEGIDRRYQTAYGLIKTNRGWKISRFSGDIKFRDAEERTSAK